MPRAVIAIATLLAAASIGRADPAAANRAIADAEARADAKDFLGAAAKYREAYAADSRPELICNVGVAYYKAQELTRAQLYLSRCLERGSSLDAKFIEVVRAKLAALEDTLRRGSYTPVDIVVEPHFATVSIASFAPDETIDGGRTVWLRAGTDRVTVRADGYVEKTVEVHPADHAPLPLHITLDKAPAAPEHAQEAPPTSEHEKAPPGEPHPAVKPPAPATTPPSSGAVPAVATTVVFVGLGTFAVYAAVVARDHADLASRALRDNVYQREADAVSRWNTIFGVDVALAGVAAAASGYLWYRVLHRPGSAAVEVTPGGAVVSLAGRF